MSPAVSLNPVSIVSPITSGYILYLLPTDTIDNE